MSPGDGVACTRIQRALRAASEALLLAMAVLAPWAYGAVDAWAELALEGGAAGLAILGLFTEQGPGRARRWLCGPGLALGGLAVLGFFQAIPLPIAVVRAISPAVQELRRGLVDERPRAVTGDAGPPVAVVPTTLSLEPESARHAAASMAAAWIVFQAVLGLRGGPASYRRFALAITANAVLLTVFSIAQAMTWDGRIYGIRRTEIGQGWYSGGPFVCHNHLAACLNLGLGFALGRLLARTKDRGAARGHRLGPAYAASVLAVGVLASHSRGGFLAMAASCAVTLVLHRGGAGKGLAAMAAMMAVFLAAIGCGSAFDRVSTILDAGASGFNGRMEVWGVAVQTWWEHPIVGTGLGGFAWAASPGFSHDRGVFFSHAENEPLQMLVEGGLVGLGLVAMGVCGVARLGWKAMTATPSSRDRATILGGLAGLLALGVQSLGDFAVRIPGVGVAALILAGHLCRMGLAARPLMSAREPSPILRTFVGAATVALSLLICRHGIDRARAEAAAVAGGAPAPGAAMPDFSHGRLAAADLERMSVGLEEALQLRPDWCEGHLRLGVARMALYEATVVEWLAEAMEDEEDAAALADPLRLHAVVHAAGPTGARLAISHEPVARFLVPAARSFLEARRSCPVAALAHAGLGGLDYLIEGGEPAAVHAERALRLSGLDGGLAARAGKIALQAGDRGLAARCWRKAFAAGLDPASWAEAAREAASALPAEMILEQVVSQSGRDTLRFACIALAGPDDAAVRDQFLRAALERLPRDPITEPERSWHEGQALAWLGDRDSAAARMRGAIESEPMRGEWREEFVDWLIGWGEVEEAHRQAALGVAINAHRAQACSTLKRAVSALAQKVRSRAGD